MTRRTTMASASVAAFLLSVVVGGPAGAAAAGSTSGDTVKPAGTSRAEQQGQARRSMLLKTSQAYRDKLRGDEWVFIR